MNKLPTTEAEVHALLSEVGIEGKPNITLVGPFPMNVAPQMSGIYVTTSKTLPNWSYFNYYNAEARTWNWGYHQIDRTRERIGDTDVMLPGSSVSDYISNAWYGLSEKV